MTNKEQDSKLTRITIGNIEQLLDLSGNKKDYCSINNVTFRGKKGGKKIMAINLVSGDVLYDTDANYNPKSADEFLSALNEVLENKEWYLIHGTRKTTPFRKYQNVEGTLYFKR